MLSSLRSPNERPHLGDHFVSWNLEVVKLAQPGPRLLLFRHIEFQQSWVMLYLTADNLLTGSAKIILLFILPHDNMTLWATPHILLWLSCGDLMLRRGGGVVFCSLTVLLKMSLLGFCYVSEGTCRILVSTFPWAWCQSCKRNRTSLCCSRFMFRHDGAFLELIEAPFSISTAMADASVCCCLIRWDWSFEVS